jgi:hypothetical protein
MSVQGLNNLATSWTLQSDFTCGSDVTIQGDLTSTGTIHGGTSSGTTSNNIWTGTNSYAESMPTFIVPVNNDDFNTTGYTTSQLQLQSPGASLTLLDNTWTGANNFSLSVPRYTNYALAGNEGVNKDQADSTMNTLSPSILAASNTFTGLNTFSTTICPTPVNNGDFANQQYVTDSINSFNTAGGRIVYEEYTTLDTTLTFTCDPALFSCFIACAIAGGGYGTTTPAVIPGSTSKSFGGAGSYSVIKIPAFIGNGSINIDSAIRGGLNADAEITIPAAPGTIISAEGGSDGTTTTSGVGGVDFGSFPCQRITGGVVPFQTIADGTINYSYNVGCLNGYGMGGSYTYGTGVEVLPTAGYVLLIKFLL